MDKFEGATEEELEAYVADSHERPGEAAEAHRIRVSDAERELLRKLERRREEGALQAHEEADKVAAAAAAQGETPVEGDGEGAGDPV